jgi:endonuclease/exonuclease/phosphatase family metal-dependent hydrolase
MSSKRLAPTLVAAAMVLFTLQALRSLLSMLFARVYDALFQGQGMVALGFSAALALLTVLSPLLAAKRPDRRERLYRWSASVAFFLRLLMSLPDSWARLVGAAGVLAASALFVTQLLLVDAPALVRALCLGVAADQVLRALGNTYDPGLRLGWLAPQAVLLAALVWWLWRHREPVEPIADRPAGFAAGLAYGSALFVLASLLALPNAGARWVGGFYALLVAWMLLAGTLPLWPVVAGWLRASVQRQPLLRWLLLVVTLSGLALANQTRPDISWLALLEAVPAFWLLLPTSLTSGRRGVRAGMVVGGLVLLLLATAHALAFTYPYTLRAFEGTGGLVLVVGAALALGPGVLAKPLADDPVSGLPRSRLLRGLLLAAIVVATAWSLPWSPRLPAGADAVRLATYNIHYGYDAAWRLTLEDEARAIEASGADLVALQEVDTGRLTSLGIDNAHWLARRLGMRVVYWPTVEHTTGIALLSRLEIAESGGMVLPSHGEPTGIVRATVLVGGEPLAVHGVWLGLSPEERAQQLEAALGFIGEGRASLAGDMNAEPDSPVYARLIADGWTDPFLATGSQALPTSPADLPMERIDYVWLKGLQPLTAQVLEATASDHRLVVVGAQ